MPIFRVSQDGKKVEEFQEHDIDEGRLNTLFGEHGLSLIEKGLRFVGREVAVPGGRIDTLSLDHSDRPAIIEYKVSEDASADALVQALSYAYYVRENQDSFEKTISTVAKGAENINMDGVRIILVAPGFDSHVEEAARMVSVPVTLVKYSMYRTPDGGDAISATVVLNTDSGRRGGHRGDFGIDWLFEGRYASMKPVFEKLAARIKQDLKVDPHYRSDDITFRRNEEFARIWNYQRWLEAGVCLPSGSSPPSRFLNSARQRGFPSRFTHYTRVIKEDEVDDELMRFITESSNNS